MNSHTSSPKITVDKRGFRRGICKASEQLGVTYTHLYRVVKGERESASLLSKVAQFYPELLNK